MNLTELLASTDNRKSRWGIKRAAAYVNSFSGCLTGGACPSSLLGVSGDQWAECLKRAQESAVYANPAMVVKSFTDSEISEGAILEFDCVMTTTRKDRDGDILESSGVTIDPDMPLLWQHLPLQPIGKFVKEIGRTKSMVQTRGAIADTPLGRDAAVLTKFKALRISHGFMPEEFEPLYNEKDQREGWHIKRLYVFEKSLVSIPSNIGARVLTSREKSKAFAQELDGIRTAFSRNLLKTEAVKQWAKHFHENRPAVGKGIDLPKIEVTAVVTHTDPSGQVVSTEHVPVEVKVAGHKEACTCQGKQALASKDAGGAKDGTAGMDTTKAIKAYGEYYLAGSYEAVQSSLCRSLRRFMLSQGSDCFCEHSYAYVLATFADSAIVCIEDYPKTQCYRVTYEMDGDDAKWVGSPEPVELVVSASVAEAAKGRNQSLQGVVNVEQKCFAELLKNTDRLRAFRDRLDTVLDAQSAGDEMEALLASLV